MVLQGTFNAVLSKTIGLLETTFFVHLTGTIILIVLLFGAKLGDGDIALWIKAPWYSWLGGLLGVIIIYLVAMTVPNVGVANSTTAIIVGQVLTALVIDYFGGFGLNKLSLGWSQIVGLILLAAGAKFLLRC